jgi:hypothetical protein
MKEKLQLFIFTKKERIRRILAKYLNGFHEIFHQRNLRICAFSFYPHLLLGVCFYLSGTSVVGTR